MITNLHLQNFRSIRKADVELGKITLLTGPNNSGKSSIIYALLALKNLVINPTQSMDSFLNLGFLNLGGFDQTVYLKKENSNIRLAIEVEGHGSHASYAASLGKAKSQLTFESSKPFVISLNLDVSFPYSGNKTTGCEIHGEIHTAQVSWNGISPTISVVTKTELPPTPQDNMPDSNEQEKPPDQSSTELSTEEATTQLSKIISAPTEELRGVDFVPLRRGFTKQNYSSVPMQQQLLNEDELATLLATNRDLEGNVAHYLSQVVDRNFMVRPTIGTANFNLQSRDDRTGLVCDLVNEGFGTNQLVTILTRTLRKEMRTICIEESEIHLHPELMGKLVDVLTKIVKEEDKRLIISTHSEHVVLSLLNKVAQGTLSPEDIKVYYIYKKGKQTQIERQEVNQKGQLTGGLKGFYEAELDQVRQFFNISEEA